QIAAFQVEVQHLWDVLDMVYVDSKFLKRVADYDDLAKIYKNKIKKKIKIKTNDPVYEDIDKVWNEITFMRPAETDVEQRNRTYLFEKNEVKRRLVLMKDKLQKMYGYKYPIQRRVTEERLEFLEHEFNTFDYMINPYHIQTGILLDVDITSIKRKKATLDGMANVLNEFLHGVSKGFQDAAFASFSRRRSTMRSDIDQQFGDPNNIDMLDEAPNPKKGDSYLDMLNSPADEPATTIKKEKASPAPKSRKRKGVVDTGKKGRGRPKKSSGGLRTL
ncbi:MAG: cytochrome C oxidase subunit II, partial [Spirochaetales bacterium]|nr:cytochrome C oxidase subunit II [Spirochaetales bacterium]